MRLDAGKYFGNKHECERGKLVYIPKPSSAILIETLEKMGIMADVSFENNPQPNSGNGMLSYLHKKSDGDDIYFFANSNDDAIST